MEYTVQKLGSLAGVRLEHLGIMMKLEFLSRQGLIRQDIESMVKQKWIAYSKFYSTGS